MVDLVGLPPRDGGCVKRSVLGIWLCPAERIANGLRVLRSKQHPHDHAAVLVMLENFLTDELTFAVAIGGEPNSFGAAECLANGFELGGFVPSRCRASVVETFGTQKYRRPPLPGWHNILWLKQVEQMALSRENLSVARTNSGADVFCLTGLLRDDDLFRHVGLVSENKFGDITRTYSEHRKFASCVLK